MHKSNAPFGLKQADIDAINSVFSKNSKIVEVILYGSRAKGTYKDGSDIDLTLKGQHLSISELLSVLCDLDELFLHYKFDISIYEQIENLDLKEHIGRVGKVFYKQTP